MRNITVSVPDDIYRHARVWAAQRDSSVSAVVAYLLGTLKTNHAAKAYPYAPKPVNPGPVAS